MLTIRKMELPQSKYNLKCPYTMQPIGIVVHNTANYAPAVNEISYMQRNDTYTSFHFAVDENEAIQGLPLNRNSWNSGDGIYGNGNRKYISIEICRSTSNTDLFLKAEKNGAILTALLLKRYGWGIEKIRKHQDFNGKYCPHKTLDLGWNRFLNLVKAELYKLNKTPSIPKTKSYGEYRLTVDSIYIRQTPNGTKIGVLRDKDRHEIIDRQGGWAKLRNIGWVAYQYMEKVDNSYKSKLGTYDLTVSSLYYRSNPNGEKIGIIRSYKQYEVVDVYGPWAKIKGYGWSAFKYFKKSTRKSVTEIAKEVVEGKWGNGNVRKARLRQAGYNPDVIQNEVNRIL